MISEGLKTTLHVTSRAGTTMSATVSTGTIAPDIQKELRKLQACDLLVLNFPVYWFSVPAILKGWIDRVLVSGMCYGGRWFYEQGGLRGKRALEAPTIGG